MAIPTASVSVAFHATANAHPTNFPPGVDATLSIPDFQVQRVLRSWYSPCSVSENDITVNCRYFPSVSWSGYWRIYSRRDRLVYHGWHSNIEKHRYDCSPA